VDSPIFNSKEGSNPLELGPSVATYSPWSGNLVQFYNDGSEDATGSSGAFHDIAQAIGEARQFVFISDWSFHPTFLLTRNGQNDRSIGQLLVDAVANQPQLVVAIHTWLHHSKAPDDLNNQGGDKLQELANGRNVQGRLLWRASARTGIGWSHHQKFVVLDAPLDPQQPNGVRVIKAFFGGLDLTKGRFDWPDHLLPTSNDQRGRFRPDDWYNAETQDAADAPRQPWHDIHAQIIGPGAADFIFEFVGRWATDPEGVGGLVGNRTLGSQSPADVDTLWRKLMALQSGKITTDDYTRPLPIKDQPLWNAQVYRSIKREHWGGWKISVGTGADHQASDSANQRLTWRIPQRDFESSIEEAYVQHIRAANDFIYIESQYFIGSGDQWGRKSVGNRIPYEIIQRINAKQKAGEDFHAYIVLPMFPEGDPADSGLRAVRQLQWKTIEYMITALGQGWEDRLSFYCLAQWPNNPQPYSPQQVTKRKDRLAAGQRYMIYVHSKLMIVDDRSLIVGSANLNERSLAGDRDTEICVGLWPDENTQAEARQQVRAFRRRLWTEHLGTVNDAWFLKPGSLACVQEVRKRATENYQKMLYFERDGTEGHLLRWPLMLGPHGLTFDKLGFGNTTHIPDFAEGQKANYEWIPADTGLAGTFGNLLDLTE
jgi:phospholipase D1/2